MLTKEEKQKIKEEKKRKKAEKKQLEKEKEQQERLLEKERDIIYKKMVAYEKKHRKEEKIAPKGVCISLQKINKIYSNHVQAVYDFSLDIKDREFIVFVGPSGCGKSTTLRMIAGLEDITAGDLYINGVYANDLEPKDRDLAMVFQSYALYPHMTVYANLAFGLQMRHVPKDEIDERVHNAAKILEIEEYLDRKPRALSGGQCQRVALGRAIVRNTRIFLMDEPLSNLDAKLRVQMRSELVKLHNELGATTVYVTHDQTEAMTMASRIVVMKKGFVQQIGTPKEIYNHPANTFVATFIGSPAMNIIKAEYDKGTIRFDNGYAIKMANAKTKHDEFYEHEINVLEQQIAEKIDNYCTVIDKKDPDLITKLPQDDPDVVQMIEADKNIAKMRQDIETYRTYLKSKKHPILFGVRPEDIHIADEPNLAKNKSDPFALTVSVAELLGNEYYLHLEFAPKVEVIGKANAGHELSGGSHVNVIFDLDKVHLFDDISTKYIV